MDRRELLQSLGGLIAIAAGGVAAKPALAGSPSVSAWLAEEDRRAAALGRLALPTQVRAYLRTRGLRPDLLSQAFRALAGVSSYRDLPDHVQREPEVQERLRRDGQDLGQAVLDVTAYLESLDPDERAASAQALQERPELADLFEEKVQAEGRAHGADPRRLQKLSRAMGRVTWRLSRQDPDLLIDDCVDTADRLADRAGLARQGTVVQAKDWSLLGSPLPPASSSLTSEERETVAITGEIIKHAGQLVCLFGLMVGGVSIGGAFILGAITYIVGITAAALILVAGLILIIIGSLMNNP